MLYEARREAFEVKKKEAPGRSCCKGFVLPFLLETLAYMRFTLILMHVCYFSVKHAFASNDGVSRYPSQRPSKRRQRPPARPYPGR